jgi:hypothetical protein
MGWIRWWHDKGPRSLISTLSFIGFVLATTSALLAVLTVIRGFPYYDPLLLRIYGLGALLSFAGSVFAMIGVARRGPLRWHAFACAMGTLLFWFVSAALE